MACKAVCQLCPRLVISDAVTFSTTQGLRIDIPAGTYTNCEKYCIVVAQAIPAATTIGAPVYITIAGDTTNLYPLIKCNGAQVLACGVKTRTRYSTVVQTTGTSGSFKLLGCLPCADKAPLPSLPVPTA